MTTYHVNVQHSDELSPREKEYGTLGDAVRVIADALRLDDVAYIEAWRVRPENVADKSTLDARVRIRVRS